MESIWRLFSRLLPSKRNEDIPPLPSAASSCCICSAPSSADMLKSSANFSSKKFSAEDKVDRAAVCEVIYNTMKALNFDAPVNYDHPLLPNSDRYWASLNLDGPTTAHIGKVARDVVAIGHLVFPFVSKENQLAIGIYTTYLVWVEDVSPTADLKLFRLYCTSDRSKLSTTLQHFASYLDHFASFYGPHGGDMIWSSTFQFLNACIVEDVHGKGVDIPRSAILFPDYQRLKSGIAETVAFAMFPGADFPEDEWLIRAMLLVSDVVEYFDMLNDVMSFYKEYVIGDEEFTFLWNYSACRDMPLIDGLKDAVSRALNAVERMRRTIASQPELPSRVEQLVLGYMRWHWIHESRYHLQEMDKIHAPERK